MNVLFALSFIILRHAPSLSARVLHANDATAAQIYQEPVYDTEIESILQPLMQGHPKQRHLDNLLRLLPLLMERNASQKENSMDRKHMIEITRINQNKKEKPITFILVPKKPKVGTKPLIINNVRDGERRSGVDRTASVEDDLRKSDLSQEESDGAINNKSANQLANKRLEGFVDSVSSSGSSSSLSSELSPGTSFRSGASSSSRSLSSSESSSSSSEYSPPFGALSSTVSEGNKLGKSTENRIGQVSVEVKHDASLHEPKNENLGEEMRQSVSIDTMNETRSGAPVHGVISESNHVLDENTKTIDKPKEPVIKDEIHKPEIDHAIVSDEIADKNFEKTLKREDLEVQTADQMIFLEEPVLRTGKNAQFPKEEIIYIADNDKSLPKRNHERYEKFYNLSFVFNK